MYILALTFFKTFKSTQFQLHESSKNSLFTVCYKESLLYIAYGALGVFLLHGSDLGRQTPGTTAPALVQHCLYLVLIAKYCMKFC